YRLPLRHNDGLLIAASINQYDLNSNVILMGMPGGPSLITKSASTTYISLIYHFKIIFSFLHWSILHNMFLLNFSCWFGFHQYLSSTIIFKKEKNIHNKEKEYIISK
ncbi:hypothetical protein ACJX0J_016253, partial [Zea mays]